MHEQTLATNRVGCVGSLLPDVQPPARLATPKYDGLPQFKLLDKTVRTTLFSCGRFPASLRGDFMEGLVDEGLVLGMALLGRSDEDLVKGAKSIARRLIHREKIERRWMEVTPEGKKVRKSRSEMRIAHPTLNADLEWTSPLEGIEADAAGRLISSAGPVNFNLAEARMVAYLDRIAQRVRVIDAIGSENYRKIVAVIGPNDAQWMLDYVDRCGSVATNKDRQRFWRLKKKLENALGRNE